MRQGRSIWSTDVDADRFLFAARYVRHPGSGGPRHLPGSDERGLGAGPPGLRGPSQEGHQAPQTGTVKSELVFFLLKNEHFSVSDRSGSCVHLNAEPDPDPGAAHHTGR